MFQIKATHGNARAGMLLIGKKKLLTPFFMPVATKGTPKAITSAQLEKTGTQCFISNSFIFSLKPGVDIIKQAGGLHSYVNWKGGIFTDSGGFQVLLNEFFVKRTADGIIFKNPFNGQKELMTPEITMQNQRTLGSDVAMAFDDVASYGFTKKQALICMNNSFEWAKRCVAFHKKNKTKQLLFCIAHGNTYEDLREKSAKQINTLDCDGFAIGGVAIGEPTKDLYMAVRIQATILNPKKPRYVMGLGSPVELLECISLGADIFDSIFPTQNARRGTLFTVDGPLRIKTKKYKDDLLPIEKGCDCYTCQHYSRSVIHHWLRTHEYAGYTLASIHNLHFIQRLMRKARETILDGTFNTFKKQFIKQYGEKKYQGDDYFQYK